MIKGKQTLLIYIYILICLLLTFNAYSKNISLTDLKSKKETNIEDDKKNSNTKKTAVLKAKSFRKFKSLEKYNTLINDVKTPKIKPKNGFNIPIDSLENEKWLNMANAMFISIDETQNYIDELTDANLIQLPVAITPIETNNTKYTMGIASAVFTPEFTKLTIFLKIETARGVLILGAEDINLSHDGGIVGDAKLNLISKFTFNINQGKIVLSLNGSFKDPKTYATIDCFGFKELSIDADITFSSDLIFPVDQNGKKIDAQQVTGNVKTEIADWNDWVVAVSLPEFGIKGLEGTTFRLQTAVLDFSDLRNDESLPYSYLETYYNENPLLWRGVYIKTLDVLLPKAFSKNNSDERVSFFATDLIIDTRGISGRFDGENILSIDEGSASKWKFSLDHFLLGIDGNNLTAGAFSGEMLLPISDETRLKYYAVIQPDEYIFRVEQTEELSFDVWNAEVNLTEDSYIEMTIKDDKFRPKASLNGNFNIATGLKKDDTNNREDKTIQFGGIIFEQLELQTEAPKFSVAYFGTSGKMDIAKFPVSINELALALPSGNNAELIIDFSINLTSESDGGNGGGCRLAIGAYLEEDNGYEHWVYDGVDLEQVNIQMDVAGMQMKGAIFIFEDDPTYGKGFAGAVGAKFTTGMSLELEAKALFGKADDFRYWFADAQVTLPTPIPVFTGFALNSFGGGFSNRMKMNGFSRSANASFNQIGASPSGVIYEPDNTTGLGFKATVGIITQNSEELFHGSLEFGMSFLTSGGLQDVYLKGEGELITSIPGDYYEKLVDKLEVISKGADSLLPVYQPEGAIAANVFMKLDFVNDIFHATSEVYVNFGVIDGIGDYGRAGWMDFYISPDEWHILVGTPEDPIGLELDLGLLTLETDGYFMTGDNIPGTPPPPTMVSNLLGVDAAKLDYMRDFNSLESGKGLAFGTHFSMTTGDLRFLIFYARFDAGVGFDLMLKDYGDAHCVGSSDPVGLNGWYASGQAYAYLQGSVGIKVKIFGSSKKISVFSGGGAVLLQASLPNPIWMKGYLGGKYSVLGGLIKGSFRFKVELGEKCEIEGGSVLDGLVVIGDMTPEDASNEVDVFAAPQVAFNLQINKIFDIPDDEGDHQYKIIMDSFDVTNDGNTIVGEVEWNSNNDVATFYSHEILPPNSNIKAYVQLHFEEYINQKWEIIKEDGKPSLDTKEINFVTGTAPETIPLNNIAYMYPVKDQKNFFIEEYNMGYINLKRGQSYLFDAVPDWKKNMKIISETGTELDQDFTYDTSKKQITYSIPEDIATKTAYDLTLSLIPDQTDADTIATTSYEATNLSTEESGNEVEIASKELGETVIKGDERELLNYQYNTSEFTTFEKKMKAMDGDGDLYKFATYPYGLVLLNSIKTIEPFDLTELVGNVYTEYVPLIIATATMDDSYYRKDIYPLLYKEYPLAGQFTVSRKTDKVSVPPIEGVEPLSWYLTYLENGYEGEISNYHPYRYNLANYYYEDYLDLRYQLISSDLSWEGKTEYQKFVTESFPLMRKGTYSSKLQYVLPGQIRNGGDDTVKYTNPLYE